MTVLFCQKMLTRFVKSALAPLESFGILPRCSGSFTFFNVCKNAHVIHAATHSGTEIFVHLHISVVAELHGISDGKTTFGSVANPEVGLVFPTSHNKSVGGVAIFIFSCYE